MHTQEMLLDVVGAIKLLLTDITVEGFLVSVDVLVAREQVPTIRGVGASAAHVPLARVADAHPRDSARASRRRVAWHGAAATPLVPRLLHLDCTNLSDKQMFLVGLVATFIRGNLLRHKRERSY